MKIGDMLLIAAAVALAIAGVWLADLRADLADMTRLRGEERAAHRATQDNFAQAMLKARLINAENQARVLTEQGAITEEVTRDYQTQLADARARADALRVRLDREAAGAAGGDAGGDAVPGDGAAAGGADGAAPADGFSLADRLIATEQAIQLTALQRWVALQTAVETNPAAEGADDGGAAESRPTRPTGQF